MDICYEDWLPDAAGFKGWLPLTGANVPSLAVFGIVEVVFNLGAPVGLFGPAYRGNQPQRAVVGPLSKTLRLMARAS
jgi:hypothetical protein